MATYDLNPRNSAPKGAFRAKSALRLRKSPWGMERKTGYRRDPLRKQQESYIKDIYLIILLPLQCRPDPLADLESQVRGYSVADLVILLGPVAHEEVVIREGLDPRCLAN